MNECDDDICEQQCINQIGTYYCECSPGCTLDINEKNCSGMIVISPLCLFSLLDYLHTCRNMLFIQCFWSFSRYGWVCIGQYTLSTQV